MASVLQTDPHICSSSLLEHTNTLRQFRRSKPDLIRLATFRPWRTNTQCNVSPALLCKVGFSYTGKGDCVKCDACNLQIDSWKPGMDPIQEHMDRSPQCPFVLKQSELFAKKDQAMLVSKPPKEAGRHVANTDTRGAMDAGGGDQTAKTLVKYFVDHLPTETVDRARKTTFSNWPSITPSAQDMAYAGWWYTNIADRVICIYCDAMFHNWTESDRPYEIHSKKSPHCPFVRTNDNKLVMTTQRQVPAAAPTINNTPNGQSVVGAVHAEYSLVIRRHQTFEKWPQTEPNSSPSIDSFADAGFFYTGDKTIVRCFYCNGALRNWQATDDPKIEHARWFPQCAYIRQYIGENLYQAIQRKNRELRAQQNLQAGSNGQPTSCAPWTNDELDRMAKARLDLPVVETLRQEGYSMAVIRKVYEMQLRFKKDDFKTDVDLRVACLILDKQVKLINGNDAKILVPKDWLKTFLEERDQQTTIDQTQSKLNPLIPHIETPKVPPKPLARPTPLSSTDEPQLCVLCLSTERQVACLPCGHLTSCVACGHSLKTCPLCRATVKAFVRIYT